MFFSRLPPVFLPTPSVPYSCPLTQIVGRYGSMRNVESPPPPPPWLLILRHLCTGECAYPYCHIPAGQPVPSHVLVTLSWPALTGRIGHRCTCQGDLSFTAALLVLLPAFPPVLPGVVPIGSVVSSGRRSLRSRSSSHLLLVGVIDPVPAPGVARRLIAAAVDPVCKMLAWALPSSCGQSGTAHSPGSRSVRTAGLPLAFSRMACLLIMLRDLLP